MSEKQMKDFHAKYKSTQLRSLENMEPTKEDIKWAKEYKEGLTIGEIAQKYGTYWERVDKGIRRVAFSKL